MAQENATGNKPEKKFRAGAISATVWLNQGQSKKTGETTNYRTISLQRGYKDKNDQWQNTGTMRVNDLPRAALVLKQAYEYLAGIVRGVTGIVSGKWIGGHEACLRACLASILSDERPPVTLEEAYANVEILERICNQIDSGEFEQTILTTN